MAKHSQSLSLSPHNLAVAVSNPGALGTIEAYIGAVHE